MHFNRTRRASLTSVNMTSLIDVLCVLVVFFMLTTKFISYKAIELGLGGESSSPTENAAIPPITINVLEDAKVEIDGLPMQAAELTAYLKPRLLRNPELPVILKAKPGISVQDIITAIDNVRLAGGDNFSIMQ